MIWTKLLLVALAGIVLGGCASSSDSYDYSAFRTAAPESILVLPPINNSNEVIAPYSVMAQLTAPIAESGYYVFPVAVVDQTFKANGLTVAHDIHSVELNKLHEIFGADAALYITIEDYGTSYVVISSQTVVTTSARLVDLRSGETLWQGQATASSAESRDDDSGIIGMLVEAALHQIVDTVTDKGFDIAAINANRLLSADVSDGLLYGPRSPKHGQPAAN